MARIYTSRINGPMCQPLQSSEEEAGDDETRALWSAVTELRRARSEAEDRRTIVEERSGETKEPRECRNVAALNSHTL